MSARLGTPLRAWSRRELQELGMALEAGWEAWGAQWGLDTAGSIRCRSVGDFAQAASAPWQGFGTTGARAVWVSDPRSAAAHASAALFGSAVYPEAQGVAATTAAACWQDAAAWLRDRLQLERRCPDEGAELRDALDYWAGGVHCQLPWPGGSLELLLNGPAVDSLLPMRTSDTSHRGPLSPVGEALAAHPLRLRVELAGCAISLGELQDLRPGDIVPLEHRLDAPLQVCIGDAVLCDALLGRSADAVAIELLRHGELE